MSELLDAAAFAAVFHFLGILKNPLGFEKILHGLIGFLFHFRADKAKTCCRTRQVFCVIA
ncbi:hypothetical protein BCV53_00790 [Parageobacillus thermoglucosidasius]|uniref:Uncharacterized protein n=1 Tax=Parageobacillus thermoglucosidasius TaxID=1426 RepID=A0AAN0YLN7_PARTM|nr:hypothetical protein BCV53_00790 [Parageobacillus thermoglucosidasius]KYD13414.1 hypothetical protein B4168_3216 [Anoxybacillus flavithermus]REK56455.1 MAG: hypothetical protein C6P36_10070 [Geobacillus sp.]APM79516.1 hypothetical protein BCV54_00795 [Parageobacillus thermoglucosidasius]KJX68372.1 hypothetical protein WH82_12825 [Parageobacillus thermoglucosidasius]